MHNILNIDVYLWWRRVGGDLNSFKSNQSVKRRKASQLRDGKHLNNQVDWTCTSPT